MSSRLERIDAALAAAEQMGWHHGQMRDADARWLVDLAKAGEALRDARPDGPTSTLMMVDYDAWQRFERALSDEEGADAEVGR